MTVPNEVNSTKVIAVPITSSGVEVEISPSDSSPNEDGHQVDLDVGENEVSITVMDSQTSASTTYRVTVIRQGLEEEEEEQDQEEDTTQQDEEQENFYDLCKRDESVGLVAYCGKSKIAVYRVELDGRYTIDWGDWHSIHQDVTGYTIMLNEFLYKFYYDGNGQIGSDALADVYEHCDYVSGSWDCGDPVSDSLFVDWDGNPTQLRHVLSNTLQTQWSSALEAPGRLVRRETFHQWRGNASDPNNEPVEVTYRTETFEMNLHYFQIHASGDSAGRDVVLVDGANGFADREEQEAGVLVSTVQI